MITIENYEEYLMMAADGELNASDKAALDAFLMAHPELLDEAGLWNSLHLQTDESVVYAEKEALLKQEPRRIAIGWKPLSLAAAAALAAMLVAIPALWPDADHDLTGLIPIPQISIPTTTNPAPKDTTATYIAALPIPEPYIPQTRTPKRSRKPAVLRPQPKLIAQAPIYPVDAVSARPLQATSAAIQPTAISIQDPQPAVLVATAEPSGTTENRLPLIQMAPANQAAIELLKRGVEQRVNQVTNAAKNFRDLAVVVKVGGNNLHLNF